jgi:hypothetical protein
MYFSMCMHLVYDCLSKDAHQYTIQTLTDQELQKMLTTSIGNPDVAVNQCIVMITEHPKYRGHIEKIVLSHPQNSYANNSKFKDLIVKQIFKITF